MGNSEIWHENTDMGDKTSFDVTTTTTIPAGTSVTITIYEDVDNDDSGPNSVTDADGVSHNYENDDSFTTTGGTDETNTLSGFDGGGSTNRYLTRVELDGDGADPTLDSPTLDSLSFDPTAAAPAAGSVISTNSSNVIATTGANTLQTE